MHALTVVAAFLGGGAAVTFIGAKLIELAHPPCGRFLKIGGLRQHVVELGEGAGVVNAPAIVLHGAGCNLEDMRLALGERLAARHRVILLDRPGLGWSERKGGDPDATVLDALAKMAEKDIGSLVVMDGEELIGIITERHYSRNVILKGKRSPTTLVREIMERNVVHVRPEQSVEVCMALMTDKRVRHLPVLEGKKVIGIVSIGDLLKSIISKQKFVIDELEHYIRG